jgi:hypothetical protein
MLTGPASRDGAEVMGYLLLLWVLPSHTNGAASMRGDVRHF